MKMKDILYKLGLSDITSKVHIIVTFVITVLQKVFQI